MAEIPQKKIFGGVQYAYHTSINGKLNAEHLAKTLRSRGWLVRTVPTSGRAYRIYARNNPKSRP